MLPDVVQTADSRGGAEMKCRSVTGSRLAVSCMADACSSQMWHLMRGGKIFLPDKKVRHYDKEMNNTTFFNVLFLLSLLPLMDDLRLNGLKGVSQFIIILWNTGVCICV